MIYDISNKTLINLKPLRIRFDEIDGFNRILNGTRDLPWFGSEKYVAIYNRIRYILSQKSGITFVFSHSYATLKVDSNDFLPTEKRLTFRNVIILWSQFLTKIRITTTLI